jgi:hypothetical protein
MISTQNKQMAQFFASEWVELLETLITALEDIIWKITLQRT